MVEKFFRESTTGIPKVLPEVKKSAEKGTKTTGTGHTPGQYSGSNDPFVVLVITEGRNNATGEVGMAAMDINAPTLILSQFSDDMWYTGTVIKIQMLDPAEIIVPNTVFVNDQLIKDSTLMKIIVKAFPSVKIKPALRKFFNDIEAMEIINDLCSSHCASVKLALEGKYYALAAAGGLFRYLTTVICVTFAPTSLQIVYEAKYGSMMIDVETSKRLELVSSLMPRKNKNSCLYQFLDKCLTNVGKRSLRARILAPLCDVKQIREFQEAVQELIEHQPLLETLRQILKKFKSVSKMQKLCLIVPQNDIIRAAELMISHVITFKSCLQAIPQLFDILSNFTHKTFETMRQGLEDSRYQNILEQINKCIVDDVQYERGQKQFFQRIHAVKEGCNVFLDISRKLYFCLIEDLKKLVTTISRRYEISLQLAHNCAKGYHVILIFDPKKEPPQIPAEFEILSRRAGKMLLRNEEIINLDLRIRGVVNEIVLISNQVINTMLTNIRTDIECFYMLTGVIVEIDLIQNFALLGSIDGSVCPSFGTDLKIVDGIHPFLEFGVNQTIPVPNNVIATSDYNFFMITGPNMGGKTVYIKMVALLQIMAQIGAFVPATEATFRICDKLFSRIGFDDTIQRGLSNFEHEIRQTEYILRNITPNSLVIIDELGRTTNPYEGKIWSWGMCEELADLKGYSNDGKYFEKETESDINADQTVSKDMKKLKNFTSPFVFLTTHFKELTKLPDYHFNMINVYLDAEEIPHAEGHITLKYTHKVKVGVTPLNGVVRLKLMDGGVFLFAGFSTFSSGDSFSIETTGMILDGGVTDVEKKESPDDFFQNTPGPSRENYVEDFNPIVNLLSEDEEEIQTEYDKILSSDIVSTQENAFNDQNSEELNGFDALNESESPNDLLKVEKSSTQKNTSNEDSEFLQGFFKKPQDKSHCDPWESNFMKRPGTAVKTVDAKIKKNDPMAAESSSKSTNFIAQDQPKKTSNGTSTESSSGSSSKNPELSASSSDKTSSPKSFMEKYRESVIQRMKQSCPLKPFQSKIVKTAKKPLVTQIPLPTFERFLKQQQLAAAAFPKKPQPSVEKESCCQEFSDRTSESQISVSSGKIPWIPDIGTLQDTQTPESVEFDDETEKKDRLVLDLAKLRNCQSSKL
uniref:DNA mismatch repair proteins mutS family domain-containing protein n=1 Tax=Phlebotomus papatasi TaxID=29031 RepID=A0A1B0DFA9_PHLPP